MAYVIAPAIAWLVAGGLKFLINSLRLGKPAFGQIGLGRLPSTHTTIVSTVAALVALREGLGTPYFGIALALVTVVVIDALDLRRRIEKQAIAINQLGHSKEAWEPLRERIGHRPHEILAGVCLGCVCALGLNALPLD